MTRAQKRPSVRAQKRGTEDFLGSSDVTRAMEEGDKAFEKFEQYQLLRLEPAFYHKKSAFLEYTSEEDWIEMSFRVLQEPKENFAFWDNAEETTLDAYLYRFSQLADFYQRNQNFNENWQNCKTALKYVQQTLNTNFIVPEQFANRMQLKEAIKLGVATRRKFMREFESLRNDLSFEQALAEGQVFRCSFSYINDSDGKLRSSLVDFLQSINSLIDLNACGQKQNDHELTSTDNQL